MLIDHGHSLGQGPQASNITRTPNSVSSTPAILRTLVVGLPVLAAQTAILTMRRRVAAVWAVGTAAIGLMGYLAYFSQDEVFSLGGLGFVIAAVWARLEEPKLLS